MGKSVSAFFFYELFSNRPQTVSIPFIKMELIGVSKQEQGHNKKSYSGERF